MNKKSKRAPLRQPLGHSPTNHATIGAKSTNKGWESSSDEYDELNSIDSQDSKEELIDSELNGSDQDSVTRPGPSDYSDQTLAEYDIQQDVTFYLRKH